MHTAKASKTTEQLSDESSHDDTEEEIPFVGRQLETRPPLVAQQSPRRTKGASSSARRESDRELQAFISMRNQVDKATEVRRLGWFQVSSNTGGGLFRPSKKTTKFYFGKRGSWNDTQTSYH